MVWFKVDDRFSFHPKVMEAGNTAIGLWLRAGTWAAAHLTDGHIPGRILLALGGSDADVDALCEAGLWLPDGDGYQFHDWSDYQPDAESLRAEREAKRNASKMGNHKRWHVIEGKFDPHCPHCREPQSSQVGSQVGSGPDRSAENGWDSHRTPPSPSPSPSDLIDNPSVIKSGSVVAAREAVDNSESGRAVENSTAGTFDLAAFRSKRPDFAWLDDGPLNELAQQTIGRAKSTVRDETAYVLRAATDPEWSKAATDLQWDNAMRDPSAAVSEDW